MWGLSPKQWLVCVHLVTLHRAFPTEADYMRQTFTAATAAPHGGHVVVKEWTVVCSGITTNILSLCYFNRWPYKMHFLSSKDTLLQVSHNTHLCCCCSGHPARWWVRSRHDSRSLHSVPQYQGMSWRLAARQEALWGVILTSWVRFQNNALCFTANTMSILNFLWHSVIICVSVCFMHKIILFPFFRSWIFCVICLNN